MNRILFFIVFVSLITSCKKKETIWNSEWNAPLISDTLTLNNWVNDSTLTEVSNSHYQLDLERTLFELSINDILKIPDTTISENFSLSVANLTIAPGFSFVNSTEEHELDMDGAQLRNIILKNGIINLTVENPIETKAIFNVKLPGVEKDGEVLQEIFTAPAGTIENPEIVSVQIDLKGYSIDLKGVSGAEFNLLQSQITVTADPAGEPVNMTSSHITKVNANFQNIEIAYAIGYFGNKVYSDLIEIHADVMDIIESGLIDIPSISTSISVENGIKVGAQGRIDLLESYNASGDMVGLQGGIIGSDFHVDPATGSWQNLVPSYQSFSFSSSNSNIESVIENLGNNYKIGYHFELNPWGNVSGGTDQLFPQSKVKATLKVNMPVTPAFDALTIKDTFDISVEEPTGNLRVKSGELILNTSNTFPISASIKLYLLDETESVLEIIEGTEEVKSSKFGSWDDQVSMDVAKSEIRFILPEEIVNKIFDTKKIVVKAIFNTINPDNNQVEQLVIPVGAFLSIDLRTLFITENHM